MSSRIRRRLAAVRAECGITMLELIMTMALLSVVTGAFLSGIESLQTAGSRQISRSQKNDAARLALAQLDREIRSGNVLYDPATEVDVANGIYPHMSLRIYTQADAPNRDPGNQCAQWRIIDSTIQTRRWDPDDPHDSVTPWWTVAQDIVNDEVSPAVPAFTRDSASAYGSRIMQITLVVDRADDAGKPITLGLSITGRNTQYSYPIQICEDIPAY